MKLKISTWLLVILAVTLAGFVYFYEIELKSQQAALQQQKLQLFNFDLAKIEKIKIERSTTSPETEQYPQILELTKQPENKTASWLMTNPDTFPVNEGIIAFLLNLIEQETKQRLILATQEQLSQYGLQKPIATITIELENKQIYKILLGKETIDPNIIYARINPDREETKTIEVVLVSKNWHYAINRNLSEWKVTSK